MTSGSSSSSVFKKFSDGFDVGPLALRTRARLKRVGRLYTGQVLILDFKKGFYYGLEEIAARMLIECERSDARIATDKKLGT